jgi:uncharacterized protein (UPF0332 family)
MTNLYESHLWLERAEDTLHASDVNLKNDLLLASVNRAYYAMFYCAIALLRSENIITKSHSGTFSKFGELFVKTNLITAQHSSNFRKAFEYRQSVDYDIEAHITEEECLLLLENAKEFYKMTKDYLEKLSS